MAINKVILLGNLGKDPELRYTPQQMAICSFSLATGERKKDQSGQWVDHTEWHNIVTFGRTAENCSKFLKKGRQAFIEGKIRTRKWQDKEGKDRYTTEILADQVQFVGGRGEGAESAGGDYGHEAANDNILAGIPTADALPKVANGGARGSVSSEPVTFDDDDIPF
jgi:single-strand DNA-binding protein